MNNKFIFPVLSLIILIIIFLLKREEILSFSSTLSTVFIVALVAILIYLYKTLFPK
jgi:amino acid permease